MSSLESGQLQLEALKNWSSYDEISSQPGRPHWSSLQCQRTDSPVEGPGRRGRCFSVAAEVHLVLAEEMQGAANLRDLLRVLLVPFPSSLVFLI